MKKDDLEIFYSNMMEALKTEEEQEKFTKYFYNSFLAGDTTIYQKNIAEFKNFDNEWIDKLEEYLPSLDKIIRSPKSTLRYDEEIIIIEKARKVTSTSIRHLAANTQYIKDIDENGDVIPKKLLSSNPEIEYGIYENRFIMTLVNRLSTFVSNRYEVIRNNIDSYSNTRLNLNSNFQLNDNDVSINLDMVVKSKIEDNVLQQRNEKLLERVTKLMKTIHGYLVSPFMRELAGKKPVLPPIMKTNIILKNPDFRNAYSLWLFLDKYNALVYDIDVQEKDLDFDGKYVSNLNQLALLTYAFVLYNQESRKEEYASKDYKEYVRKATKIVRTNPKDIVDNPDAIAMEDNTINEYYLDQNKKLFKTSLSDLLGSNMSYEEALRTAMQQTMDITNNLFKSVFELNPQIRDEVEQAFEKVDIEKDLTDARKRAEIAKIIRETKEMDFQNAISLEKEQLDNVVKISEKLVKESKDSRKKSKTKKQENIVFVASENSTDELNLPMDSLSITERKIKVLDSIEKLSKAKIDLYEESKRINETMMNNVDEELIELERERAKLEREEELIRQEQERQLALQKEYERYIELREKIREKYRILQESIISEESAIREEEIQKLREKFDSIRNQELEKIRLKLGS